MKNLLSLISLQNSNREAGKMLSYINISLIK